MKHLALIVLICTPIMLAAQSIGLNRDQDTRHLIERYAVLNADTVNTSYKPISRRAAAFIAKGIDESHRVDAYNKWMLETSNFEYTENPNSYFGTQLFYANKASLYGFHKKDIDLSINPILEFNIAPNNFSPTRRIFYNRRGIRVRGMLAQKVAFQTEICDVQERGPYQFDSLRNKYANTVQGQGFFLKFKDRYGVDYLDTRSTLNFKLLKNYIDLSAGFGKNFIGDGYRSLFLSENSNSYLFTRLNVNFWKIRYQSLTSEYIPFYPNSRREDPQKYSVMNYLTIDALPNLTFGLFEGVIIKNQNRLDYHYLVPLIFLRSIERNLGSKDNATLGGSVKWNIKQTAQLYGQLMFDEFIFDKLLSGNGSITNKYGFQIGSKYFNAFRVPNLDLQAEMNYVRPFTYQHRSEDSMRSLTSYTHYDQPLAHPLGAGFKEYIAVVRYQPLPKLQLSTRLITYHQGMDSTGVNTGNNPLEDYRYPNRTSRIRWTNGPEKRVLYTDFMASYYFLPHVSIDARLVARFLQSPYAPTRRSDMYFTIGLRANTFSRTYDY